MKLEDAPLSPEFKGNARDIKVLMQKSMNSLIVSHESTFKGTDMYSIRELYLDALDNWAPGKGLTVPKHKKDELIAALKNL